MFPSVVSGPIILLVTWNETSLSIIYPSSCFSSTPFAKSWQFLRRNLFSICSLHCILSVLAQTSLSPAWTTIQLLYPTHIGQMKRPWKNSGRLQSWNCPAQKFSNIVQTLTDNIQLVHRLPLSGSNQLFPLSVSLLSLFTVWMNTSFNLVRLNFSLFPLQILIS